MTLANFGIGPYLIASALSGVVAQRLLLRIFMECRQWYTPSPASLLRHLDLKPGQREWQFAYGTGRQACDHTWVTATPTGLFGYLRDKPNNGTAYDHYVAKRTCPRNRSDPWRHAYPKEERCYEDHPRCDHSAGRSGRAEVYL